MKMPSAENVETFRKKSIPLSTAEELRQLPKLEKTGREKALRCFCNQSYFEHFMCQYSIECRLYTFELLQPLLLNFMESLQIWFKCTLSTLLVCKLNQVDKNGGGLLKVEYIRSIPGFITLKRVREWNQCERDGNACVTECTISACQPTHNICTTATLHAPHLMLCLSYL